MTASNTFTIYNASAGSGKTFTLVKEYLLLLFRSDRPDNYRNILAITFTNKAVEEMKTRIINSLHAFSMDLCPVSSRSLLEMIKTETAFSEEEIRLKSQRILRNIIHNYAAFEVSTIDGFTHRVLRTFARDLDLPLNFEVELNTADVLQEAVERLIDKAGEDKELTRVLINFAISKTDEDKSWDIARDLFSIAQLVTSEDNQPFLKLLKSKSLRDFERLTERLSGETEKMEKEVVRLADDFFSLLEVNGIDDGDFSGGYCPKWFRKLQEKNFDVDFGSKWQQALADEPLYAKKLVTHKKDILDGLQPEISDLFNRARQKLTQIRFFSAVLKNLTPLSLLSVIQNEIELIKKERSIVLISEFNATIGSAVKDQPAPFIYERLGEKYQHYFIDEFQDTSQLQWENLIPLVDHSLSTEHPEEQNASLTLVGDAKQSIYRWRGGKAEQFMDLCNSETGKPFNLEKKEVVLLPHNFRSARNIVEFNNDFFKHSSSCFSHPEHKDLFESTSSQNWKKEDEGYVNISFVEAENAQEEMQIYPERALEIIRDLENKKVSKRNICILTRTKKEGVAVASFLNENAVPVISAETLLLSQSSKVNFITAVLHLSIEGQDRSLKLEILDFLLEHNLRAGDRYEFIAPRLDLNYQKFFDSLKSLNIDFSLSCITEVSLYEAVEYIVRSFSLVGRSDAYVQSFLDFIYENSQKENFGIFEFLQVWEQKKDSLSISASPGGDAVQIMTIHKAKGLEFPVVIYPFANSSITDVARESLWMSLPESPAGDIPVGYIRAAKDMLNWGEEAATLYNQLCHYSQLDALNVLYVALTRPVKQLYIVTKYELTKSGENENKFSGLFISWLKSKGLWNDSQLVYEFGNPLDLPLSEETTGERSVNPVTFISSSTESSAVSFITRSGLLWDSKQEKAIEKGQVIHDIFAGIDTAVDVLPALQKAREEGLFKTSEEGEIRKHLLEVVNHPQLQNFFNGSMSNYNERDIIGAGGEILRPDRLNFCGREVSILDYKTGEVSTGHKNQINGYAQVLSQMGFEVKQKILVYINEEVSLSIV